MGEIRADQKARLSFKTDNNSEKELDCLIKKVYSDRVALYFPTENMPFAKFLQEGEEIPVKIYTPNGIKSFDAMILNSPFESEFVIEYVEDCIKQIQRREYQRCAIRTKIIIERLNGENIVTHTIDIGGGGVRFFHPAVLNPDEKVFCRLYLPLQNASVQAKGHILSTSHLKNDEYVFIFDEIDEKDRDRVIKVCFDESALNSNTFE